MNFDPYYLLSTLAVSGVGFVLFSYGRRMRRFVFTGAGVVMMIYPYFVSSVPWMLVLAPVCLFALWLAVRLGL